jgi:hypothetical protein
LVSSTKVCVHQCQRGFWPASHTPCPNCAFYYFFIFGICRSYVREPWRDEGLGSSCRLAEKYICTRPGMHQTHTCSCTPVWY